METQHHWRRRRPGLKTVKKERKRQREIGIDIWIEILIEIDKWIEILIEIDIWIEILIEIDKWKKIEILIEIDIYG